MALDIRSILEDWPYEPGKVVVRRISGQDGRVKIQLRLDLGLLQMEVTGRPDGQRPHDCETLLDFYENQLQRHAQEHGGGESFELDEEACELLRSESVMFYHRYLAEFVLEDFEGVQRDTAHNLRMMDFLQKHAKEESDRYVLEQYRPYVLMMCTRARAQIALGQNRPKAAHAAVRKGIEDVLGFYRRSGQQQLAAASSELSVLRVLQKEIEGRLPVDPVRKLRAELSRAIKEERYEQAAQIRDRLVQMQHRTDDGPKE